MTDSLSAGEARPIAETERIVSLDVLRGFAIFGIFMVNIAFFSMPLFVAMEPKHLAGAPVSEQAAWLIVKALFEIKFITLFSLLFGIGLIVQMKRIEGRGGAFVPVYVRRLATLAAIGLVHGLLIWYGDILFMYAVAGVLLLLCRSWSAKQMFVAGAVAFAVGGLFYIGGTGLGALEEMFMEDAANRSVRAVVAEDAADIAEDGAASGANALNIDPAPAGDPWERFVAAGNAAHWRPRTPHWDEAETIAYREGPFAAAFIMRGFAYAAHILFAGIAFGFWLRILAVFLLGAAMMKVNFFSAERRRWHWRCFLGGFLIALPLEVLASLSYPANNWTLGLLSWVGETVHYFSSMGLTIGYVGAICLMVHSGALRWITAALAAVGRMALTNYLGQSVVATFIMYWWGLGLFGEFSRTGQIMLVLAIFLGQIIFSVLWLRLFRFGPLEWGWRAMTYLQLPPMRR